MRDADDLLWPRRGLAQSRAVWTAPIATREADAPASRIVHVRTVAHPAGLRLRWLDIQSAQGYFKCGGGTFVDRVASFRVRAWRNRAWETLCECSPDETKAVGSPREQQDVRRTELGDIAASAAIIECRSSEVDGWWPSWNLASSGLKLRGEAIGLAVASSAPAPGLIVADVDESRLPRGLKASRRPGEIRFSSPFLQIGFRLRSSNLSYLSIDQQGRGRTDQNLLAVPSALTIGALNPQWCGYLAQGTRIRTVEESPALRIADRGFSGSMRVKDNCVQYTLERASLGLSYELCWEILPDQLILRAARTLAQPIRAWDSGAWHMAFDGSAVAPPAALGAPVQRGQSGLMRLPVLLHWPGRGTLQIRAIASPNDDALFRSDCVRPANISTAELKLFEQPQDEGDYLLHAGRREATFTFSLAQCNPQLSASAPAPVVEAVERCSLSGLPFRADTATLSDNAQSIHAPMCMDTWSSLATRVRALPEGFEPMELLRLTLERWLAGGPAYGSGRAAAGDSALIEDEYLITGAAAMLGLAEYLQASGPRAHRWLDLHAPAIERELGRLRRRDLDDDGLIESDRRRGVSGEHQWSTCWYDVISFGWKDAFSNALLYRALGLMCEALPRLGKAGLSEGLKEWSQRLRNSYRLEFWNPKTHWLAGWRCKAGELHDHAFLFVNGAAVCAGLLDEDDSRRAINGLWLELMRAGFDDFRLGLPGNVWTIPPEDLAEPQAFLEDGVYQNRGATHSQSRHFVSAMYRVGLTNEADRVLEQLCSSLADATAFGGCGSGVDWRCWDGSPCGYEGLLSDQFGILAVALDRYSARGAA